MQSAGISTEMRFPEQLRLAIQERPPEQINRGVELALARPQMCGFAHLLQKAMQNARWFDPLPAFYTGDAVSKPSYFN